MSDRPLLLIVDDDPLNLDSLVQQIESLECEPMLASNGREALKELTANAGEHGFPGVVLTDVNMPVMDGLDFLVQARAMDAELPIVLITAYGDVDSAVKAMKDGAYDFIERPCSTEILCSCMTRALENRRVVLENRALKTALTNRSGMAERIIGRSPEIVRLRRQIGEIANTDVSVVINGETGTGKDLVARCLHDYSTRREAAFVAVNCGAIPESLVESELFGHEKGAFTGADRRRIGHIEHADGGTLFLDEIESMPVHHQIKLLRVLQERTIERLGSNEPIAVNFRLVAASKTDLGEAARNGEFREDLYFRMNVAELHIPPLRDRREDIPLLFEQFTQELAARHNREAPAVTGADMQSMTDHDWQGNVRELRNVAERHVLGLNDIRPMLEPLTLAERVGRYERDLIIQALAEHQGNVTSTAESLEIARRTLYDKMQKHGVDPEDFS